jgi:endoglucanase Acf2
MQYAATVYEVDHLHYFLKIMYAAVNSRIDDWIGREWAL